MIKLHYAVMAIVLLALPCGMAQDDEDCTEGSNFTVNEGDKVILRANVDTGFGNVTDVEWTPETGVNLNDTATEYVEFIAPAVDTCTVYNISIYLATSLLDDPASCVDEDCIKFTVCPQDCPEINITDACWDDFEGQALEDNNTYTGEPTFNWTIFEITTPLPADPMDTFYYIGTTQNDTLLKQDIANNGGAPTAEIPERCFQVSYNVTSDRDPPEILLDCENVDTFCLVYKPEVEIEKSN